MKESMELLEIDMCYIVNICSWFFIGELPTVNGKSLFFPSSVDLKSLKNLQGGDRENDVSPGDVQSNGREDDDSSVSFGGTNRNGRHSNSATSVSASGNGAAAGGGARGRPYCPVAEPSWTIAGGPSVRAYHILNDKRHVLTKDTAGCVDLYDVLKVRFQNVSFRGRSSAPIQHLTSYSSILEQFSTLGIDDVTF